MKSVDQMEGKMARFTEFEVFWKLVNEMLVARGQPEMQFQEARALYDRFAKERYV